MAAEAQAPRIEVVVNGETRWVAAGSTVTALIEGLGLPPLAVAVEHNGVILKRASYASTGLTAGDRLEVVRFVQGGRDAGLSFDNRTAIVPDGQGPLAQLVEQQTLNLRVRGSIPWRLTSGSSGRPQAFQLPPRWVPRAAPGGVRAKVAELAYALDLGSSPVHGLGVRAPPFAPPEDSEARLQ